MGKFVTGDNNYSFEPVAAIIYGTFVTMCLMVELLVRLKPLSELVVANAVELLRSQQRTTWTTSNASAPESA